jgi:anti-sigma B factor antagonist
MRESADDDGAVRLMLVGELDIAVADAVQERLRQHRDSGRPVVLDLSELEFIDSSGVQAVVLGLKHARKSGHALEVDRRISPSVERMVNIMGIAPHLWPGQPAT